MSIACPRRVMPVAAAVSLLVCGVASATSGQTPTTPPALVPSALTLADAERLLVERNVAIAATRYQLSAAQAARLIASYKPNPTVQVAAEQLSVAPLIGGSHLGFFDTHPDAGAQPTYTVQFSKIFERGGKRELRIAQADATVEAAEFLIRDTIRQQLFQLRQAFGTALLARENLRLAQQINAQFQRSEQLTVIKTQAGDLSNLELYRIRAGRLVYQQAVVEAGTAYQQATRDILNLLNAAPTDVRARAVVASVSAQMPTVANQVPSSISIVGEFVDRSLTESLDDLTKQSLEHRPDVQLARRNLIAAERGVDLAKAQRSRDVIASVEYQHVGSDHALGLLAQVPLFVYNNQMAGIAQAEAQRHAAGALLHEAERQAVTDVAKAYVAYLAARQLVTVYSADNLVQVQRVQDITQFSFQQGSTSLFELLEVQRNTQQALVAYNQARANYQSSLWQLEEAVGAPIF